MDCPEIRDSFLQGKIPTGTAVAEHLKVCPHCSELFQNGAALGLSLGLGQQSPSADVGSILAAVEGDVARETGLRAVLRSLPTKGRVLLACSSALLIVAAGGLLRLRADFASYPQALMLLVATFYVAAVGVGVWGVLRPLSYAGPRARLQLIAGAFLVLSPALVALLGTHVHADELSAGELVQRSLYCFVYGSLLGAPLLILLWALDRAERIAWTASALAGATLGVTANLVLQLHCPVSHTAHLLLGHALIGLVWAVAYGATAYVREQAS